jgi:hypothetical protein
MRVRSLLHGAFTLVLALAIAGAPAKQLTDSGSERGASLRVAPHASAALVGTTSGTPDGDLRPGDERDPAPPLPGSTAGALLLAGTATLAFLVVSRGRRLVLAARSDPHPPRAPPASVTV